MNNNLKCPECGCESIGRGKLRGYASLHPVSKIFSMGSEVIAYVCTNCGYIVKLQAEKPYIFKNHVTGQDILQGIGRF
jgi:predicted nucleic-acid-binding Zn-ribbon protein